MPQADPLLIWLVPLLAATGLLAGTLAGLLGVGGGIVIVPVLYHVFSYLDIDLAVRMHLAIGTSLATIVPTSLRSLWAHHHRGAFDSSLFGQWAPWLFAGVLVGTWLANLADFTVLALVFAVVALVVSVHMAFGKRDSKIGDAPPGGAAAAGLAGFVGAISAMMGIGGGTLSVPILTLYGEPIHRAVGTAAGFGAVIAIPGCLGFMLGGSGAPGLPPYSLGYVNWLGFLLIVPATLLTAPVGARLAHAMDPAWLRRVFAVFLGLTALRMLIDAIRL